MVKFFPRGVIRCVEPFLLPSCAFVVFYLRRRVVSVAKGVGNQGCPGEGSCSFVWFVVKFFSCGVSRREEEGRGGRSEEGGGEE
jgi:hypothetical protein